MKKILPFLLMAVLACSCSMARYARGPRTQDIEARSGRGIIEAVEYPSGERDLSKRRMTVYLPEDYYRDSLRSYPVLYLLHGARGNEVTWDDSARVFHVLDSLRGQGLARDFILVLPNMNNYFGDRDYKDGHAVNAVRAFWTVDGEVERYFMHDVVARTDSLYRTQREKGGRAIAGMSSGALQALYLSASYPRAFDYVGLSSPYTYAHVAACNHDDVYGSLWRKLRRQFSDPPKDYSLYIGKTDFFYPHILLYDRKLTRKGYPHRLIIAEGGHQWYNWSDFLIDFSQQIFR
ncbi:MAG: hypothetical protein K5849_00645 [Bacteroidales bacterium]|nr:hypothetical protein [Bacteroidales bacterium]